MHSLQPKHSKLSEKETEDLLSSFNISKSQLPKILLDDPAIPKDCQIGDIIKIERKIADGKPAFYYRVVV
ncbi:DNA-directed RNA polymerase subunit H [Candidatus Pacearchaeota archaeon]|nr:DNA-directed RNA polymerase subunit H [Candidatus Pacearchaeota archaeon]